MNHNARTLTQLGKTITFLFFALNAITLIGDDKDTSPLIEALLKIEEQRMDTLDKYRMRLRSGDETKHPFDVLKDTKPKKKQLTAYVNKYFQNDKLVDLRDKGSLGTELLKEYKEQYPNSILTKSKGQFVSLSELSEMALSIEDPDSDKINYVLSDFFNSDENRDFLNSLVSQKEAPTKRRQKNRRAKREKEADQDDVSKPQNDSQRAAPPKKKRSHDKDQQTPDSDKRAGTDQKTATDKMIAKWTSHLKDDSTKGDVEKLVKLQGAKTNELNDSIDPIWKWVNNLHHNVKDRKKLIETLKKLDEKGLKAWGLNQTTKDIILARLEAADKDFNTLREDSQGPEKVLKRAAAQEMIDKMTSDEATRKNIEDLVEHYGVRPEIAYQYAKEITAKGTDLANAQKDEKAIQKAANRIAQLNTSLNKDQQARLEKKNLCKGKDNSELMKRLCWAKSDAEEYKPFNDAYKKASETANNDKDFFLNQVKWANETKDKDGKAVDKAKRDKARAELYDNYDLEVVSDFINTQWKGDNRSLAAITARGFATELEDGSLVLNLNQKDISATPKLDDKMTLYLGNVNDDDLGKTYAALEAYINGDSQFDHSADIPKKQVAANTDEGEEVESDAYKMFRGLSNLQRTGVASTQEGNKTVPVTDTKELADYKKVYAHDAGNGKVALNTQMKPLDKFTDKKVKPYAIPDAPKVQEWLNAAKEEKPEEQTPSEEPKAEDSSESEADKQAQAQKQKEAQILVNVNKAFANKCASCHEGENKLRADTKAKIGKWLATGKTGVNDDMDSKFAALKAAGPANPDYQALKAWTELK